MEAKDNFSLALGLFDYINPIFYSITSITIIKNIGKLMSKPLFIIYLIGAIVSIIFGLSIPTVKAMVGLGKMKFKMPVNLVFYVNSGIFLSGIALSNYVLHLPIMATITIIIVVLSLLALIYAKKKKFNTIAVLIGMAGYIMIYCSLISIAVSNAYTTSIVMYAIAICLFLFLCGIGIFANLKDAIVHWVIEISNVLCQGLVAISTILLFTLR